MLNAGAYKIIEPSFQEPEILMQFQQASGFIDLLEGGKLRTRLAEDDLVVYMKQMNVRTKLSGSQASGNELPGVDISTAMISTMTGYVIADLILPLSLTSTSAPTSSSRSTMRVVIAPGLSALLKFRKSAAIPAGRSGRRQRVGL